MSWMKDPTPLPFNSGDRVHVRRCAISIDKEILGKLATVVHCTRKLVEVERNGVHYVFTPDELILREETDKKGPAK
jgi:hypothetical protein